MRIIFFICRIFSFSGKVLKVKGRGVFEEFKNIECVVNEIFWVLKRGFMEFL